MAKLRYKLGYLFPGILIDTCTVWPKHDVNGAIQVSFTIVGVLKYMKSNRALPISDSIMNDKLYCSLLQS